MRVFHSDEKLFFWHLIIIIMSDYRYIYNSINGLVIDSFINHFFNFSRINMKIGIVCYPTFGGSGVVATELGMALADKGHEVHFITYNQPVRLDFISHNLHFHEVLMEEYPLFQYQPYELAFPRKW